MSSVEVDNKLQYDRCLSKSVTIPTNSRATNTNTLPLSPLIKVEL